MIESLLARYGLLAILVGAGIEGEAVLLSGGVLVSKGFVPLWAAMIAATLGSAMIDQLWFWSARFLSHKPWVAKQTHKPAFARALHFLERHPKVFIMAFRFIYGMRTVSPIALGMSTVRARVFVPLNFLAAAIWAPLFIWLGYRYGEEAIATVRRFAGQHVIGLFVVVAFIVALALFAQWRRKPR
jgi:membrane protein DedA with SNARE-associated domain